MTDSCGIYCILSPSGKTYIGSSIKVETRWRKHKSLLEKGKHHSPLLQNAYKKYDGKFEFILLMICEKQDLLKYEQLLIDSWKPEYNINPTAGNSLGVKRAEETRKAIGQASKGRKFSEEVKQKMSLDRKGQPRHPNLVASHIGRKCSDETKEKMRQSALGRKHTEESKKKMSESRRQITGWKHTEETKLLISQNCSNDTWKKSTRDSSGKFVKAS